MLILLHIRATFFRTIEAIKVAFLYYRNLSFLLTDLLLLVHYVVINPHQISRTFLKKKGNKNIYQYGETPLTTLDTIAMECQILSRDIVLDLGCGPGRTTFWLHYFIRCHVIGIDFLPIFISRANKLKGWMKQAEIFFIEQDFFGSDFTKATVIYLYGTCVEEDEIKKLISVLSVVGEETKIITVSYPLNDFCESPLFKVVKQFSARFPWGKAQVYLQYRS